MVFGGTGPTAGTVRQNGATSAGSSDLVVAKYTDNGTTATVDWTQVGGGTGQDQGNGIAVSGTSVYVTGYITNNTSNTNGVVFGGTGPTAGTVRQNGASAQGLSSVDLVVAKYTDNGTTATLGWTQVGGGTDQDQGNGIAVSGTGSVYVTGYIRNSTGNLSSVLFGGTGTTAGTVRQNGATAANSVDLVVAKYTDNGTTATLGWTQVGGGNRSDQGLGIAVSGTSVYVTGYITNSTANDNGVLFGGTGTTAGTVRQNGASAAIITFDLVVAKYTDNGTTATLGWTQVGGGASNDQGLGIAVSGTGSVYVAGSVGASGAATFGTAAGAPLLGTAGNRAVLATLTDNGSTGPWQTLAAATNGGTSQTRATAVDAAGNVFVTGYFTGQVAFGSTVLSSAGFEDLFVAKYVPATATWAWAQSGGGTSTDQGNGIAVSGTGSVYVTGYITNNTANASGVVFGGTGPTAGTVPQNGATSANSIDLVVVKYTDNGTTATLDWTQVGGGTGQDQGNGIAVSGTGSVYVTGYITNNTANASGVVFGGTGPTAGTVPQNGATSANSIDLVVVKYTDNGTTATVDWTQVGGGAGNDQGYGIAASGTSVYVTGYIINNTANTSGVVFGGTGPTAGTVQVNGASATNSSDLVVVKYTDNGTTAALGWTQVGGGTGQDQGFGIATSGSSVYVTGYIPNNTANANSVLFGGTGTTAGTVQQNGAAAINSQDLVVVKYTDNGATATVGWTQVGGGAGNDQGLGIAVSGSSVYVTGYISNNTANANSVLFGGTGTTAGTVQQNGATSAGSSDLVVAKYTDNGATATVDWTQVGGGTSTDQGTGIAVSGTGSVYVTGYITNNTANASGVVFGGTGPTAGTVPQNGATSANSIDLVVVKYTDNGTTATVDWTQVGGGTGSDQGNGIAVSGTGSVYVAGYIVPSATFGSFTIANPVGAITNFLGELGGAAPLPVELTAFTATAEGPQAVRLVWATASEVNSTVFEVERSLDGRTFAAVGRVAAAGSSEAPRRYTLLDGQLPAGPAMFYYRLRQVDQDGTFSYSSVRVVTRARVLYLYPNPTTGAATLTGAAPGTLVQVLDALGRPMLRTTTDASGTAQLRLPAGQPTGVYLVRCGTQTVRLLRE